MFSGDRRESSGSLLSDRLVTTGGQLLDNQEELHGEGESSMIYTV